MLTIIDTLLELRYSTEKKCRGWNPLRPLSPPCAMMLGPGAW